jgi:hypothetical protein
MDLLVSCEYIVEPPLLVVRGNCCLRCSKTPASQEAGYKPVSTTPEWFVNVEKVNKGGNLYTAFSGNTQDMQEI